MAWLISLDVVMAEDFDVLHKTEFQAYSKYYLKTVKEGINYYKPL